jgi:hypothetical protein
VLVEESSVLGDLQICVQVAVAGVETTGSYHQDRGMSAVGSQNGHWEEVGPHDRQREIAVSDVGDCQGQSQ